MTGPPGVTGPTGPDDGASIAARAETLLSDAPCFRCKTVPMNMRRVWTTNCYDSKNRLVGVNIESVCLNCNDTRKMFVHERIIDQWSLALSIVACDVRQKERVAR